MSGTIKMAALVGLGLILTGGVLSAGQYAAASSQAQATADLAALSAVRIQAMHSFSSVEQTQLEDACQLAERIVSTQGASLGHCESYGSFSGQETATSADSSRVGVKLQLLWPLRLIGFGQLSLPARAHAIID